MKCKSVLCLCLLCVFIFSGCRASHQLETASIVQSVTVARHNGQLCYTFYCLSPDEKPPKTVVPAPSFEKACQKAREQYIPHLTLAKLNLLMVHRELAADVLLRDMDYIAGQSDFSPVTHVCVGDSAALEAMDSSTKQHREAEQLLLLCRRRYPRVKLSYLSVFNSLHKKEDNSLELACLISEKELKVEPVTVQKPNTNT